MKFYVKSVQNTLVCLFVSLILSLLSNVVLGADAYAADTQGVTVRQADIEKISTALEGGELEPIEAQNSLRLIRIQARNASETLDKQLGDVNARILSLGAAPLEGQVEAPEVAERRQELAKELAETNALIAQARLNLSDATRLLNELAERQRFSFMAQTFKVENSLFLPAQWKSISSETGEVLSKFTHHVSTWKQKRIDDGLWTRTLVRGFGLLVSLIILLWPFRQWIGGRFENRLEQSKPTELNRFISLFLKITLRVLPVAVGSFVTYGTLARIGFITPEYTDLAKTVIFALLAVLLADGFAVGLFNPATPEWRILPLKTKPAKHARWISIWAISLYGVGVLIPKLLVSNSATTALDNAGMMLTALGVSGLLILIRTRAFWALMPERSQELSDTFLRTWSVLNRLTLPLALLIFAALVFGYQNLAYFLSVRVIWLIGIFLWVWVIRRGLLLLLKQFDESLAARHPKQASSSREAMMFWAGLVIDAGVLFFAIPIAFLVFGSEPNNVKSGLIDAFTGMQIGNFTISLSDILAAIVTFFVILFVTRFLQRTLDARLFSKSGADEGFRNSFRTLLGYVGLIIAIIAAISVVGLDLSKLAIIAGALSVGIGFGLQSIVNNFVSGLILLFERPIKVGDWVVTSSGEGIVKKISVRSTEIETFDRASVIVPNSELISSSVKNWTHKNKMGRVIVPVGIAYGSDAKKVRDLLLQIAKDNPLVLSSPEPFVYFKEFGASSLDMELRAYVKDVSKSPIVRNDLRFEILDAFRTENIEIPFPQHDLHIKSGSKSS